MRSVLPPPVRRAESGSVIIMILVFVGLFAALSFAVGNMSRGGGDGRNRELRQLTASEIVDYGRGLRSAAQKMSIDGAAPERFSFEADALDAGYVNPGCASSSCRLFLPSGGGASYVIPNPQALDANVIGSSQYGVWYFTGQNAVTDVGATDADLIAVLSWLKRDVCIQINNLLGVGAKDTDPPQEADDFDVSGNYFNGAFAGAPVSLSGDPAIAGQRAACIEGANSPATGTYHFYQVLIAR